MAAETLTILDSHHIHNLFNANLFSQWLGFDSCVIHNSGKPFLNYNARLSITDSYSENKTELLTIGTGYTLSLINSFHGQTLFYPYLTDNGGIHRNTLPTVYDNEVYLKCRHQANYLTGTYTSPIYDRGSSLRELIYILAKIAVIGSGTNWEDKVPIPVTWSDINATTATWAQIFDLTESPTVQIDVLYGETSPPITRAKRMEILSAILTARYYRVEITITDPSPEVNALVQNYTMKFCS
jgi:hypothetical protein